MTYFIEKPETIKISLTNICNYKCVMCYNPTLTGRRGFIDDATFHGIIDDCVESGIGRVSLGATGEPLLHRHYLKYLAYAKASGLWVSTTSNCSRLTPDMTDAIFETGVDRFNISIYSANPTEHIRYTKTDCFKEVVDNVTYFLRQWNAHKENTTVNLWFLSIPGINDFDSYRRCWGPIADGVGLPLFEKEAVNWGGRIDLFKAGRFGFERDGDERYFTWKKKIQCPHVRYYLHILHTGDVLPCCTIPEVGKCPEVHFGNVRNDTILDIWRSPKYNRFKRNMEQKKNYLYPPCSNCSDVYTTERVSLSFKNLPRRVVDYFFTSRSKRHA